jgi:hypothetical protein
MNKACALVLLGLPLGVFSAEHALDTDALYKEASGIATQFVGQLKPELQAAMQAGGPAHAIPVCAEKAPAISRGLSAETGWSVRRVSLKPRNPAARPDTWEREQLQVFDREVAAGSSPAARSAWVEGEFRYIKPQPVGGLCLTCHGQQLAPEVIEALGRHYPGDVATGYALGEVRGGISLRWRPVSAH